MKYVGTIFTNGRKIRVEINKMEYPMPLFENKHKMKTVVDEENRTDDRKIIQNKRVNIFIAI